MNRCRECGNRVDLPKSKFCDDCILASMPSNRTKKSWGAMSRRERKEMAPLFVEVGGEIILDPGFLMDFQRQRFAH